MINSNDRRMMNNDIAKIIDEWSTNLQVKRLKPSDQQPMWNSVMREIIGEPEYDVISDIPVEMCWLSNESVVNDISGNKYTGKCNMHIPTDRYDIIEQYDGNTISIRIWLPQYIARKMGRDADTPILFDEECVLMVTNDALPWKLYSIKCMPGDTVLQVRRIVGDPNGG